MDAKKIGERLTELRGNTPRAELAKAIGVSVSALSMYECGERIPRDVIKVRIAKYFRKSVESIFFKE